MNPRFLAATLALSLTLASGSPRRDLDVGIPPGSPLDWGRAFPALSPRMHSVFPQTRSGGDSSERSKSRAIPMGLSTRTSSSFALVRILTWDLGAHLAWIGSGASGPLTGRSTLRPDRPEFGAPLYWVSLAPLLRLLLHPGQVSRAATIAHLVEIGDASVGAIDEAAAEPSLRRVAREVRERVAISSKEAVRDQPARSADARTAMLTRFAREELLRDEPYDPEAAFGARLFLFADELFPILCTMATGAQALELRRNAVAALARFDTNEALRVLLEIASKTDDDVVLFRALSGLGRRYAALDWSPLIERLAQTKDVVRIVALVAALGRSGSTAAVEPVIELARSAFAARDADLLEAALSALAQLPAQGEHSPLDELLADIQRLAHNTPRVFSRAGPKSTLQADRPDGPRARGRVIESLAIIARVRLDPTDGERSEALFSLVPEDAESSASSVPPAARLLFLDALGSVDTERSRALLGAISRFAPIPVAARALAALPFAARSAAALETIAGTDSERRLLALETLLDGFHERSERLARGVLSECADAPGGEGSVSDRALWLAAVRALDLRERLTPRDLRALLPHVQSARDSFAELPVELEERVVELIQRAADGAQKVELRELAEAAVDFVLRHNMNAAIDRASADDARRYVIGLLASVRAHRTDPAYVKAIRERILGHLLGYSVPTRDPAFAEFEPPVLLGQEILFALARTGRPQAVELILQVLENTKNRHRAVACLALGMAGEPTAADRLAHFLLDADPFTRFCAAEALRHLVEYDDFFDWIYGPANERFSAAEETWSWLVEQHR